MKHEDRFGQIRQRIVEEVRSARRREDRWLLVHLTSKGDKKVGFSADSVFEGFKDCRELRGPRWRTLANALEFSGVGYSGVVAGDFTAFLLFRYLLTGKVPKGVIMHVEAVHRWASPCVEITATVSSVRGFLDPQIPEYRGLGAKRLGRAARTRMMSKGCQLCGSKHDLTLHHLIPREMGGATEEENLLSVCRLCHDGIHRGEIDVTALAREVFFKRINWLLQSIRDDNAI